MPIMLHKQKVTIVTGLALLAAGCARSDFRVPRRGWQMSPTASDIAALNAAEAKPPKILPETHYAAARLFESQGLVGRALIQYRKAVAVNHSYAQAYHRLGLLLGRLGEQQTEAGNARRRGCGKVQQRHRDRHRIRQQHDTGPGLDLCGNERLR